MAEVDCRPIASQWQSRCGKKRGFARFSNERGRIKHRLLSRLSKLTSENTSLC